MTLGIRRTARAQSLNALDTGSGAHIQSLEAPALASFCRRSMTGAGAASRLSEREHGQSR
jgi:hypothetical protein